MKIKLIWEDKMKKYTLLTILLLTITMVFGLIITLISGVLLSFRSHKKRIYSIINSKYTFKEYVAELMKHYNPNMGLKYYLAILLKNVTVLQHLKIILILFIKIGIYFLAFKLVLFNPNAIIWSRLIVLAIMVVGFLYGLRYVYLTPYSEKINTARILSTAEWFIQWSSTFNNCDERILSVTRHENGTSILDNVANGININDDSINEFVIDGIKQYDKSTVLFKKFIREENSIKTIIVMALIFLNKSIDLQDYQRKFDTFGSFSHKNYRSKIDQDIVRFARLMNYQISVKKIKQEKPDKNESKQIIEEIYGFIGSDIEMPKNNKVLLFKFRTKKSISFMRLFAGKVNLETGKSMIGNEPEKEDQFINCSDLAKLQEIARKSGVDNKSFDIRDLVIISLIKSKKPIYISSVIGYKNISGAWGNLCHRQILKWILKAMLNGYRIRRSN